MERCDHCRFWRAVDGVDLADVYLGPGAGECRRHAPALTQPVTSWPRVAPDRWCGEFQLQTGPMRPGGARVASLRAVGDGVVRLA